MINPIMHSDYEKISDDLYMLGYNAIMRFNVLLGKSNKENMRYGYHHEYKWTSNKYKNKSSLITIRRSFDYFITIENLKAIEDGTKESIMIRIQDILYVRENINNAVKWFRMKNLFAATSKNKIVLLGKVDPIIISGLANDKYIKLEPIVIQYDDHACTGIRMTLSANNNYVDITLDNFMAIVYILNTINMYESAQLMINYLQRPEYGENMYEFENQDARYDQPEGFVKAKTTRKIGDNQKSFFDQIDDL